LIQGQLDCHLKAITVVPHPTLFTYFARPCDSSPFFLFLDIFKLLYVARCQRISIPEISLTL
jgi:hypothetical protein